MKQGKGARRAHTNRILLGEFKLESVDLVAIQRIVVEDPNIHMPLLEVVGGYEIDARR